jgi:hypothetical protein
MNLKFTGAVLLFLLTNILSASDISGYWFNPRLNESIRIIKNKQFILVKGLFLENRTSKFKNKGRGVFVDRAGNSLILENRNTIRLRHRNANEYIRFEKVREIDGHNQWRKYHDYDDDFQNFNQYGERIKDGLGVESRSSSQNDSNQPINNASSRINIAFEELVGTWKAKDGRYPTVAIIDHREGLKAKFTGSTNWVTYLLIKEGINEFIDPKGNRYIFETQSKAKWISVDSKAKIIEIVKSSAEVQY